VKFLSVCSGIEAASTAWNPLGWEAVAFSEIEPFPCSLLAHHYPNTPNWGDMNNYKDWPDVSIDLLCGGTPCQSFSVAGLRKGLDDPRGNLMLTYGAIAAKYRPKWLVWENVPGVLSSNGGRDFGTFLGMLGQLGYGFAYRVLDAQYFGVAQRRRRVFVVGCLGGWRSAAAVLFERHSLQGHPAPRRQAGQKPTGTISSRTTGGGGLGTDFECSGGLQPVAGTMKSCKDSGGWSNSVDHAAAGYMIPVAFSLQHAQIGRKDSNGPQGKGWQEGVSFTMDSRPCADAVATFCMSTGQAGAEIGTTLHCGHEAPIVFDTTQITSAANYSSPKAGDPCHPLAAQAHVPAIAVSLRGREGGGTIELGDEVGNCLRASGGGGDKAHVLASMQVRRLTPGECESLQGFKQGYTNVPHRGKPAADGPRYKAIGNSWAVPNVRWIGERIDAIDALLATQKQSSLELEAA
jgi:DNA (cytosine-5)-methyltransferase 1